MQNINSYSQNGLTYGKFWEQTHSFVGERKRLHQTLNEVVGTVAGLVSSIANFFFSTFALLTSTKTLMVGWIAAASVGSIACFAVVFVSSKYLTDQFFQLKRNRIEELIQDNQAQKNELMTSTDIKSWITRFGKSEQVSLLENMNFEQLSSVRKVVGDKHFEALIRGIQREDHQRWKVVLATKETETGFFNNLARHFYNDYPFFKAWNDRVKSPVPNSFLATRTKQQFQIAGHLVLLDEKLLLEHCSFFKPKTVGRELSLEEKLQRAAPKDQDGLDAYIEFLQVCTDPLKEITIETALRVYPFACEFGCRPLEEWLKQIILDKKNKIDPAIFQEFVFSYPQLLGSSRGAIE